MDNTGESGDSDAPASHFFLPLNNGGDRDLNVHDEDEDEGGAQREWTVVSTGVPLSSPFSEDGFVWTPKPTYSPVEPIPVPTDSPTNPVTPDISIDTFDSTCSMAAIGFVMLFGLYAFLRSRKAQWSRKVFAPRLFTARIAPRVQPRSPWGWVRSLVGRAASRRVLEEVGMDAFMVNRVLVFCAKAFACLAPFALFILIPLYGSLADSNPNMKGLGLEKYTIKSMLNSNDNKDSLWIVIGMTYWNSFVVLYLLHSEYRQYIRKRHDFLRHAGPQSYTVLVERIPKKLCNRSAVMHYFRKIFGNRVLAADVVDNNPVLNYAVKKRLEAVTKLERACYELEMTGRRPWRLFFPWMCGQMKQRIEPLDVTNGGDNLMNGYRGTARNRTSGSVSAAAGGMSAPPVGLGEDEPDTSLGVDDEKEGDQDTSDISSNSDDNDRATSNINIDDSGPSISTSTSINNTEEERGAFYSNPSAAAGTTVTNTTTQAVTLSTAPAIDNNSNSNTTPLLSDHAAEEQAFLEQWQHNMEQGLVAGPNVLSLNSLGTGSNKRQPRCNCCLRILARLNLFSYVDAIKSNETELKVWNRRVRHLKRKAEKKRQKLDAEAKANVVEPSLQVIQDQIKVRLRQERRSLRKTNGTVSASTTMSSASVLRRRSGSFLQNKDRSGSFQFGSSGAANPNRNSSTSSASLHSAAVLKDQEQQQQDQPDKYPTSPKLSSASNTKISMLSGKASVNSGDLHTSSNDALMKQRRSSLRSTINMPWDDDLHTQFHALISDQSKRRSALGGFVGSELDDASTSAGSSRLDDDSSYFWSEDEYFDVIDADDGHGLFEHAGFDDLLRYAVDQNERSSAFVTFSTLTATMCAAESVVDRPLKMSISIAPDLRDVLWENLGLSLPVLALFTWVIRALLVALVLVFGVVSASLAALTNLDALTKVWPWLKDWLEDHKEWGVVVQQISPMVMVLLYNLVPPLINLLLKIQRRRSLSEAQVEFFRIYFHFLVIQVFLFYTIAGGLLQNLHELVNRPFTFLSLLGKALPANELFFLRYLITRCFLLGFDLLRLSDICIAFLRGIFKSSRTARERRSPCCGWHTIDHPNGGQIERTVSTLALCFCIALSYSVICPAMSVAALIYFVLAMVVYRNQLLYVYTHERESAGILFPYVFRALITSVLVFQLIMIGIFTVHGNASFTLLLPLVFVTLTFLLFCENAYENSSRYIPLGDAAELDIINGPLKQVLVDYKHPSTLAPVKLEPEPVDTDSFKALRLDTITNNDEPSF